MDEPIALPAKPMSDPEYQDAINEMLVEMKRLDKVMEADRAIIDRLKADNRRLKAETRSILSSMGVRL